MQLSSKNSGLCSKEKFMTKMEELVFQNETSSKRWLMHIRPLLTVAEIRLNITYVNVTHQLTKRWLKIGFLMHVEIDLTKLKGQTSKHWFIFANTMRIGWGHNRDFTMVKRALQELTSQHLLHRSKPDMSSWKLSMHVFFFTWSVRWEWKVINKWWHAMRVQRIHLVNKIETIFVF